LKERGPNLHRPDDITSMQIFQNSRGDLLTVSCCEPKKDEDQGSDKEKDVEEKDAKVEKPREGLRYKAADKESDTLQSLEFPKDMHDYEFSFTGDFLCWKRHDESIINFTNITTLKELHHFSKDLSMSEVEDAEIQVRTIDLSEFMGKTAPHLVSIDPCDVS